MTTIQINVNRGGIFSKLVRSIDKISFYDYNNFILNTTSCSEQIYNKNYFAGVFDFKPTIVNSIIDCDVYSTYTNILQEDKFFVLQKTASSLKYSSHILDIVNDYTEKYFTKSTLGVHIRLTDMHTKHPNYGFLTVNDFIRHIDNQLDTNKYESIFVSSDNKESITKLKQRYGNLMHNYACSFIVENEVDDNYFFQLKHLYDEKFWNEVFIDMLILSKTKHLIHRISNYSNAALLFSNTINTNTLVSQL